MGLLGALALNSSMWWNSTESGSGSFASTKDAEQEFEDCVRKAMNNPVLGQEYKCTKRDPKRRHKILEEARIKVSKTNVKGGAVSKDGKVSIWSKISKDNKPATAEKPAEEVKEGLLLTITAATFPNCTGDCAKGDITKTYRATEDGTIREFEVDDNGNIANGVVAKTKEALDEIYDKIAEDKAAEKDRKKEEEREKRIAEANERKYKNCLGDLDGNPFFKSGRLISEKETDFDICVDTQLSQQQGEELMNFIETRLQPSMLNWYHSNRDKYDLYKSNLASARDSQSGWMKNYLNATLAGLNYYEDPNFQSANELNFALQGVHGSYALDAQLSNIDRALDGDLPDSRWGQSNFLANNGRRSYNGVSFSRERAEISLGLRNARAERGTTSASRTSGIRNKLDNYDTSIRRGSSSVRGRINDSSRSRRN